MPMVDVVFSYLLPAAHCWVSTWMGDCLCAGKPSPRPTQPSIPSCR